MKLDLIDTISVPLPTDSPVTWKANDKSGAEYQVYPPTFRSQARMTQECLGWEAQSPSEEDIHLSCLAAVAAVVKEDQREHCAAILEGYQSFLQNPKSLPADEAVALAQEAANIRQQLVPNYQPLQELMSRQLMAKQFIRFIMVKHHLAGWNDKVRVPWETSRGLVKEEALNRIPFEHINGLADYINLLTVPSEELEKNSGSQSSSSSSPKSSTAGKKHRTGPRGKSSAKSTKKTRASKSAKT